MVQRQNKLTKCVRRRKRVRSLGRRPFFVAVQPRDFARIVMTSVSFFPPSTITLTDYLRGKCISVTVSERRSRSTDGAFSPFPSPFTFFLLFHPNLPLMAGIDPTIQHSNEHRVLRITAGNNKRMCEEGIIINHVA